MNAERRTRTRVNDRGDVKVTILSAPDAPEIENRAFACVTDDISASGLRFRADAHLPAGATLELRFAARGGSNAPLWHIGRVVWTRPDPVPGFYRVGVQFTRTPQETLAEWERLIEEKLSRPSA